MSFAMSFAGCLLLLLLLLLLNFQHSAAIAADCHNDKESVIVPSHACSLHSTRHQLGRANQSKPARIAFGGRSGQHHVKDPLSACLQQPSKQPSPHLLLNHLPSYSPPHYTPLTTLHPRHTNTTSIKHTTSSRIITPSPPSPRLAAQLPHLQQLHSHPPTSPPIFQHVFRGRAERQACLQRWRRDRHWYALPLLHALAPRIILTLHRAQDRRALHVDQEHDRGPRFSR